MSLSFSPITLADQAQYLQRLSSCPVMASDYSFINIWGWAVAYRLSWAWEDSLVWIRQELPFEKIWAPIGPWGEIDWNSKIDRLFPDGVTLHRVPTPLCELLQTSLSRPVETTSTQGDWDYLYHAEDLKTLSGNRFHKKKNLVHQFQRAYPDARYQSMDENIVTMALDLQEDWCLWRDCEASDMLTAENQVIARVLSAWENLTGIIGGALTVDDTMVAYTVGERFSNDTLLIHFEKGHHDYKGCYQAINQSFIQHSPPEVIWVNREQDLDDPGLRKAKLSYQPADYVKKSKIVIG
jgi:uncharacterized protein